MSLNATHASVTMDNSWSCFLVVASSTPQSCLQIINWCASRQIGILINFLLRTVEALLATSLISDQF